jgi:hypothetical protein
VGMVLGEPFNFARHGVTQNLVASGMTGGDWSAWYRRFSYPRPDETQPIFTFCCSLLTERKKLLIGSSWFGNRWEEVLFQSLDLRFDPCLCNR